MTTRTSSFSILNNAPAYHAQDNTNPRLPINIGTCIGVKFNSSKQYTTLKRAMTVERIALVFRPKR